MSDDTTAPTIYLPESDLATEIARAYLSQAFRRWEQFGAPLTARVNHYQGDGRFMLTIEAGAAITWVTFLRPVVIGSCWIVADSSGQPVACWSVPKTEYCMAQENHIGSAPLIDWP